MKKNTKRIKTRPSVQQRHVNLVSAQVLLVLTLEFWTLDFGIGLDNLFEDTGLVRLEFLVIIGEEEDICISSC